MDQHGLEFGRDESLSFESPVLVSLYDYWHSKCHGRDMPARSDISPTDLGANLAHVFLVDVEYDPERFRLRLVGTHGTEFMKRDYTGKYYDEAYSSDQLSRILEVVRYPVRERRAIRHYGNVYFGDDREFLRYESAHMPLSGADGRVAMLFGAIHYGI